MMQKQRNRYIAKHVIGLIVIYWSALYARKYFSILPGNQGYENADAIAFVQIQLICFPKTNRYPRSSMCSLN